MHKLGLRRRFWPAGIHDQDKAVSVKAGLVSKKVLDVNRGVQSRRIHKYRPIAKNIGRQFNFCKRHKTFFAVDAVCQVRLQFLSGTYPFSCFFSAILAIGRCGELSCLTGKKQVKPLLFTILHIVDSAPETLTPAEFNDSGCRRYRLTHRRNIFTQKGIDKRALASLSLTDNDNGIRLFLHEMPKISSILKKVNAACAKGRPFKSLNSLRCVRKGIWYAHGLFLPVRL